jgi:hypothetical protein
VHDIYATAFLAQISEQKLAAVIVFLITPA